MLRTIIGDYYLIIKSIEKQLSNNLSRQIFSIIVVYLAFPDFKLWVWGSAFVFMRKTCSTLFAHGGSYHGLISYSWKLSGYNYHFPGTVLTGNHMQWSPSEISNKYNVQPGLFAFTLSHPERKKTSNTADWLLTLLFVPTSIMTGRHTSGSMPLHTVYRASFPTGIPIPQQPRSPRPRIRSPSVITMA